MDKRELMFKLGFMQKSGGVIGSGLKAGAKYLGGAVGGFVKKRALPNLAMGTGWALSQNIFKNISEGEELNPYKIIDESVGHGLDFMAFEGGLRALGAGARGIKNNLARGVRYTANALGSGKGAGIQKITDPIATFANKFTPEGKVGRIKEWLSNPKNRATVQSLRANRIANKTKGWGNKAHTAIGVGGGMAIGGYLGRDEDAPISSTLKGAVKGGLLGGLTWSAPGIGKVNKLTGEHGLVRGLTSNLRAGLGIAGVESAVQGRAEREQKRAMKKYYEQMGYKFDE